MTSVLRPPLRLLVCSLIYAFVSIVGLAAPASADSPGCVSRAEFSVVQNEVAGHARTERMVQGLFDARGELEIRNPGRKLMFYPACWIENGSVWVGYRWEYGRLGPDSFGRGWFYEFKSTSL